MIFFVMGAYLSHIHTSTKGAYDGSTERTEASRHTLFYAVELRDTATCVVQIT